MTHTQFFRYPSARPTKVEHQRIAHELNALTEWVGELHQRFPRKGKVLICLEQSRRALIYLLMGYDFVELYPINHSQLASYREIFSPAGAKDDRPDSELICELLYFHQGIISPKLQLLTGSPFGRMNIQAPADFVSPGA